MVRKANKPPISAVGIKAYKSICRSPNDTAAIKIISASFFTDFIEVSKKPRQNISSQTAGIRAIVTTARTGCIETTV